MNKNSQRYLLDFFKRFKLYSFKKRDVIIRPFFPVSDVFYLKKGFVKCYVTSKDGSELTFVIFKPDDILPMTWIKNTLYIYYFEALTNCELYKAPKDKFLSFMNARPEVAENLMVKMSTRLGGILQRMEYLAFGNAGEKVASTLMICAERFGEKKGKSIFISIPLTQKDIASLVGMTRETTSIEINKLKRQKIISSGGYFITILNINKLKSASLLTS